MAIVLTPLPFAAAVVTTNTAPAIGKTTYYSAMAGNLAVPLLALSGLNDKARFSVRRDPKDISNYTITFTCPGADAFYSSGATSFTLPLMGEQRDFQVVTVGGTKYWAPAGPLNPVAGNDVRYVLSTAQPVKPKVQITDNCYGSPNGTGTFVGTYRWPHTVGVAACEIQLEYANWTDAVASPIVDADASTALTFSVGIEDPATGYVIPCTFGGQRQITMGGGGKAITDPVSIDVNVGDVLYERVFVASGTYQSNHGYTGYAGGGGVTATTDLTGAGAAAIADVTSGTAAAGPGASAIIGTPTGAGTPKAVFQVGDSIGRAPNDGSTGSLFTGFNPTKPQVAGGGFMARALNGHASLISTGQVSDQAQWFNANKGHFRRQSLTKYARYGFIEYGTNDLFAGQTAAQLQASLLLLATRNIARGCPKNFVMTLLPHTSSTDRWTTTGNQTAITTGGKNTSRITHNNWVRAGCPIDPTTLAPVATGTSGALLAGQLGHPITDYLEVADVAESSRDSGLWKVQGRTVSDCSATAGSATITSATAAFVSGDVGSSVVIGGAGTAAADFIINTIFSVTNSTTAVLANANASLLPATTVTNAQLVIGSLTGDGLHPNTTGHTAIAAAIQTALLAKLT